ncbi:MAG: BatD, partial [Labilithrix sp.]|nr:BatD [Labilithrix sp.]
ALEAGVLAETGVNLRGAARATSQAELAAAGVATAHADEILALAKECEDARFSPEGVDVKSAAALWERARAVLSAIEGGA